MGNDAMRRFDLWGVPFDGGATLGWPGARYAPDRARKGPGLDDHAHRGGPGLLPRRDGGARRRGDVAVVPQDLMAKLEATSDAVAGSVRAGRVPIVMGGEDSLFYPSVRALHDAVEGTVGVIHFDAHLDLLDQSPQQGRFSHSSGMRRSLELERVAPERCIQVGGRHFNFPSSAAFIEEVELAEVPAVAFHERGTGDVVAEVLDRVAGADHVFWSFDIDVVDPAEAPGAGAHDASGITARQALDCVRLLAPRCDGFAVTEVNPLMDLHDRTATLAAYLVFSFAVHGAPSAGT